MSTLRRHCSNETHTHVHTHCSLIAATRGPTQVQSAHHTQSSRAKLTCSSIAAWLSPMLLPNTPFRSAAAACSVLCPVSPCRERQAERASHEQRSSNEGKATNQRCLLPGDAQAPSKYPVELLLVSSSSTKRRSGGRYLLVITRAGGIGVREVDFCGACDQEQTKVRNLPFGRFRGPLCPVAIGVPHFPHCTIWQPRCRGASAMLLQ